MRVLVRRFLVAMLCLGGAALLGVTGAAAQPGAATGVVQGVLIDPQQVVISNLDITVTLKNTSTGASFTAPVIKGEFTASGLPAGTYDIDIPIPCCMYSRVQHKAITVAAGQTQKLDFAVGWGMNLGTIGDDPGALGSDLRAKTKNVNGKTPRLRDGKPDLSGMWINILDPAAGFGPRIPMKPWAQQMQGQLMKELGPALGNDPGAFCMPSNATPTRVPFPYEFVQGPKKLVQMTEFVTPGHRVIYMDGRKHPDLSEWNPAWYGHSIGRWEGDTLVVDSIGFNEAATGYGIHSEKLHVVERIRRPTYGRLEIEITAEDPEAWTDPVTYKFLAGLAEGEDTQEFLCTEAYHDRPGQKWKGRPDGVATAAPAPGAAR